MNELNLEGFKVFSSTRRAIAEGKQVVIQKGGTGSGKSFQIMMFLIAYADKNKCVITVVSESKPHLDIGVIRIAKLIMGQMLITEYVKYNESKSFFTFPNGSIIEFFSADRIDKALGARRDLLFGNEINSLKLHVWDELARRSTLILGDFNPTAEFWLEDWLRFYPQWTVITSNYLDNPKLPVNEIERIKLRASLDPNFRRVHIDCEYGTSEGLVYQNFELIDEFPLTGCEMVIYGMDWGYVNDPTVLLMVGIKGNDTYIDELIYQTGLTNRAIIDRLNQWGFGGGEIIYSDVEPKSIDELKMAGFAIRQVVKGKVEDEIRRMRDLGRIYITKRSTNTIKEIRSYTFATDRQGKTLNVPLKADDHAMDAMRYARLSVMKKNKISWS